MTPLNRPPGSDACELHARIGQLAFVCVTECPAVDPVVAHGPSRPQSGSGTILVVEDDADVRTVVAAQLEELGYTPLLAASGPEALDILAAPGTPVDLLLTDMVMPGGMNGVALVQEARRQRPDLRALLTSGYMVGNIRSEPSAESLDLPLLSKPYQHTDLARAVREALDTG